MPVSLMLVWPTLLDGRMPSGKYSCRLASAMSVPSVLYTRRHSEHGPLSPAGTRTRSPIGSTRFMVHTQSCWNDEIKYII